MEPSVDNVIAVFRAATPKQYADGKEWYLNAHKLACRLDPTNVNRAAGVISAFSPQAPWWRTIRMAEDIYSTGVATGHTGSQNKKAQDIFDGAEPMDILGGKKTTNFYLNISDPWNPRPITIDAHAIDIAIGQKCVAKTRPALRRKGVYEEYAEAYRAAALLFNLLPNVMQAITWVTWRETNGLTKLVMSGPLD